MPSGNFFIFGKAAPKFQPPFPHSAALELEWLLSQLQSATEKVAEQLRSSYRP